MVNVIHVPLTGGCMCGAVRYEAKAGPSRVLHCHCQSCRKHAAAPVAMLAVLKANQIVFTGGDRKICQSSPGVGRAFCAIGGTSRSWETVFGNEGPICAIHISAFDNPEALAPTAHSFYPERISWFGMAVSLPRYKGFVAGGSLLHYGPAEKEPSGTNPA